MLDYLLFPTCNPSIQPMVDNWSFHVRCHLPLFTNLTHNNCPSDNYYGSGSWTMGDDLSSVGLDLLLGTQPLYMEVFYGWSASKQTVYRFNATDAYLAYSYSTINTYSTDPTSSLPLFAFPVAYLMHCCVCWILRYSIDSSSNQGSLIVAVNDGVGRTQAVYSLFVPCTAVDTYPSIASCKVSNNNQWNWIGKKMTCGHFLSNSISLVIIYLLDLSSRISTIFMVSQQRLY